MLKKVKNLFSFLSSRVKKHIRQICLAITTLGALLFALPAYADLGGRIIGAALGGISYVLLTISQYIAMLAGVILKAVLNKSLMTNNLKSYTDPAHNIVIQAGLPITQGLVNMILVLVLIFIGLATILRLESYPVKKLLPIFIIIALLVNFSPVLCGLAVDGSNIVINFFTQNLDGTAFRGTLDKMYTDATAGFWHGNSSPDIVSTQAATDPDSSSIYGSIINGIVLFIVELLIAVILFAYALVLFVRYIAIWILVILSPLAFACYILPATKKYWEFWLNQFIRWCIVGIPLSFFLYLGINMIPQVATNVTNLTDPFYTKIFSGIMADAVPVIILYIGFIYGMQTSAMGASAVFNWGKRAGGWTYGKAWKGMALGDRKIVPKARNDKEKGWYNPTRWVGTTTARSAAGGITKTWEAIPGVRWFRPEPLRKFSEFRGAMEGVEGEITGPSDVEMDRVANGMYTGKKAAAAVNVIVKKRGDSNDFVDAYIRKYKKQIIEKQKQQAEDYKSKNNGKEIPKDEALSDDQALFQLSDFKNDKNAARAFEFINKAGELSKLFRNDPRLAIVGRSDAEGQGKMLKAVIDAKPGDAANWEREAANDQDVMLKVLATKDEGFFRSLAGLKGGAIERQKTINSVFKKFVDEQKLDIKNDEANREKFYEHLRKIGQVKITGFEKALTNERFTSTGYDKPTYNNTTSFEPGAAAGMQLSKEQAIRLLFKNEPSEGTTPGRSAGASGTTPPPSSPNISIPPSLSTKQKPKKGGPKNISIPPSPSP